MLHVIGDSHAMLTFRKIPNVITHHLGAITLKRIGYLEDHLLLDKIKEIDLKSEDILLFCFGEIDIRCYVKPLLLHRKTLTLESLLESWITPYIYRLETINIGKTKKGIMSVVPPSTIREDNLSKWNINKWPVGGTDKERALYTQKINEMLYLACEKKRWLYFDVYSRYKDESGMLPVEKTDGTMHIGDNKIVIDMLKELKLI